MMAGAISTRPLHAANPDAWSDPRVMLYRGAILASPGLKRGWERATHERPLPTSSKPPSARLSDALSVRACGPTPQQQVARAPGSITPPRRPAPPPWGRASSPAPRKSRKAAARAAMSDDAQKVDYNMINETGRHQFGRGHIQFGRAQ